MQVQWPRSAACFHVLQRLTRWAFRPASSSTRCVSDLAKDVPGTFKQLYEIGFREVETAGFGAYSAKDFRRMLDDAGLKAPSAHLRFAGTDFGPLFETANTLGAHFATSSSQATANTPPPPSSGSRPTMAALGLDGFTKLAAKMNDIGTQAKAAGLQYAYHNHNYEFEKMPDGALWLRRPDQQH